MAAKAVAPRLKRFALHLQIHAFSISAVILAQIQQMLCPLAVSRKAVSFFFVTLRSI